MSTLSSVLNNRPLVIAAVSWLVAGLLKVVVELRVNKKLVLSRIVGAGGMPSSHTSTVIALAISIGFYQGLNSAEFALAMIFAIIVIHDAVGVRLETGKQAKVLNTMMFESEAFKDVDFEQQLKEYVGHTPLQALIGALVGIAVTLFMIIVIYK